MMKSIKSVIDETSIQPSFRTRAARFFSESLGKSIARELSTLTRYRSELIQIDPHPYDSRTILAHTQAPKKSILSLKHMTTVQSLDLDQTDSRVFLLNGNLNYSLDIQSLLSETKKHLTRSDRLAVIVYNSYLKWIYQLSSFLKLRLSPVPDTFLTFSDLKDLAQLSGYQIVLSHPVGFLPFDFFPWLKIVSRILRGLPFFRYWGVASIITLRPLFSLESKRPSLTVLIPARNEKGNIPSALERMPNLNCDLEVLFVEGNSTDQTWEEINRIISESKNKNLFHHIRRIRAIQQKGKGKCDAVRTGLETIQTDLAVILDADLTVRPEDLPRFYEAYVSGAGDFINGTRLVYPLEDQSMRFLNRLGNIFFAKALSFVLSQRLTDSLCGTKLFRKQDYDRMVRWRKDFGDFDPFGDFELLFSAAQLGLGIQNIPIHYKARVYGETNIRRFRDGWILLKMTLVGLFRIRFK